MYCISILILTAGSLQLAYNNGGPAPAIYGWLLVSVASMSIGLSMAEILSGLPASGGPYFWASWLAAEHGPFLSWVTGWFNLLGQIAVTASISSALMSLIRSAVAISADHEFSPGEDLAVYAGTLISPVWSLASSSCLR